MASVARRNGVHSSFLHIVYNLHERTPIPIHIMWRLSIQFPNAEYFRATAMIYGNE